MKKLILSLCEEDRVRLTLLLSKGRISVHVHKRARILQLYDEGLSAPAIGAAVGTNSMTARRVRRRYLQQGLERALYDAPRPGARKLLRKSQEARIVALVCSSPPRGSARWSTSLIAKEAISRGIVGKVRHETIRLLLHRHDLKPWREKNVVCSSP